MVAHPSAQHNTARKGEHKPRYSCTRG